MKDELKKCIFANKEPIPIFDEIKGIWTHEGHRYVCYQHTKIPCDQMDRYCDVEHMKECVFYKTMVCENERNRTHNIIR